MEYKFDNVKWGVFYVGGEKGLFYVAGTTTTHPSKLEKNGKVPRVTCSATNNGIEDFYKNKATEKGGVITVDSATDGYIAYQKNDFIATDHVEKIENKDETPIKENIAIFIKCMIEHCINGKHRYGYKFSQERIKHQQILLPITEENKPDWDFMDNFIEERKKILKNKLLDFIYRNFKNLNNNYIKHFPENWKDFFLSDIFTEKIKRGKRLTEANQITGQIPFISSSGLNNGVSNFISNKKKIRKSHFDLTLANSGSVGNCFFHPYEYIASDHVTTLTMKNGNENKYLFLSTMISRLKEKYTFNREISDKRIQKEKVFLPINKKEEPDWSFMESFINNIKIHKIKAVIDFLNQ